MWDAAYSDPVSASTSEMVEDLAALVRCESPSSEIPALARCADLVALTGRRLLGTAPERVDVAGVPQLAWPATGEPRVLLLAHLDTVWPLGSLATHPWTLEGGIARGPGVFDMKAGLVMALHALADLPGDVRSHVTLLVTADEETGAPTSRPRILTEARRHPTTLVLEASAPGGAWKDARRGVARFTLEVRGRAAHAGLDPHAGINAITAAAPLIAGVAALDRFPDGASVTATTLHAGSAVNTVPARAELTVDVRTPNLGEQTRVEAGLRALEPGVPGSVLVVTGGATHPPLERSHTAPVLTRARAVATGRGLEVARPQAVGGASDGNIAASVGSLVLDGLGAVGGGAHADDEHVRVADLAPRTDFLAALTTSLVEDPL